MKVLIMDALTPEFYTAVGQLLPDDFTLDMVSDWSDEAFAAHASDADILIGQRRRIDAVTLTLAPNVRFIQLGGAGFDTIDVEAVQAAGIPVCYNPGVNAVSVAEHTVMLILGAMRRFAQSEQSTRAGRFDTFAMVQQGIFDLEGSTVGLLGLGMIGQAVATRLAPFDVRLLYHRRARPDDLTVQRTVATYVPLDELLASSRVVSVHVPLTTETYHLIGERELALMPRGSYLVNTARGGIVDEAALRRALEDGHLAGAALDVLEHETSGRNTFADMPQVVVTPHTGGLSQDVLHRLLALSVENICRFVAGEPVRNLIPGLHINENVPSF